MSGWRVYGLVQINNEPEVRGHRFSPIIVHGETRPELKIPPDTTKGWKRLTAIYSDKWKEVYLGSLKRTLFYYGAKVWINCPTIFFLIGDTSLTFKADLFANNRRVPGGNGKFKYHRKTTSPEKIWVTNGYAEETNNIIPKNGYDYQFFYEGSETYKLSESVGTGYIYKYTVPEGKIPLTVTVPTVILNEGENGKLIARVTHRNYTNYVKSPEDIPSGGYVTFYIDNEKVTSSTPVTINSSGFATVNIKATQGIGTHNIVATFTPFQDIQDKYVETSGSGTLFIGNDTNKPKITSTTPMCTYSGDNNKEITFTTTKKMNGTIQLYFDLELVHLKNSAAPEYRVPVNVNANSTFKISFDTLQTKSHAGYHWNYSGYHNMILVYTEPDEESGVPMEYWYYMDDFYMQIPIELELVGDLNNYSETVGGEKVYVGDNLFYLNSNGNVTHYKPTTSEREVSTTVANPIKIKVTNTEHPDIPVEGGHIRLTIVSRTENNDMEDTTKLW